MSYSVEEVSRKVQQTLDEMEGDVSAEPVRFDDKHMQYIIRLSKGEKQGKLELSRSLVDDYLDSGDSVLEWKNRIKMAIRELE